MDAFRFTQCAAVLFDAAPSLDDLEPLLEDWQVAGKPKEGEGEHGWLVSGPGFVLRLRSGGFAVLDVVDRPWPDEDPNDPARPNGPLAAAWRSGAFGPLATPGALLRAADQPWRWDGGPEAAWHRAFVRLRTGHGVAPGEEPRAPDPLYELTSLTELAATVLRAKGARALFFPAGEALRSPAHVYEAMGRKIGVAPPPVDLWTNLRAVALGEGGGARWLALDTVGMGQLGLPDQEAIFAEGREEPRAVEALLGRACLGLVTTRSVDEFMADPGGRRWRAARATAAVTPSRPAVRWTPLEGAPPQALLEALAAEPT